MIASLPAHAWEAPETDLKRYCTLTMDYETPHTPWARPYASGQLRGLYLLASKSEGMHTHAREAIELMQRVDLKLDAAYWYRYYGEYWFGGDAGRRRVARLMHNRYDVLIFQDVGPDKLDSAPASRDARRPFLEQVRAGAGVALIGTDDGKLFAGAQVLEDVPPFLTGTGAVKVMALGKGRIVQMPPRPLIPYRVGWETEYDYWQEKLTRAVVWAAKREPPVQLGIACAASLDRHDLPAKAVTVTWKGARPGATTVSLRLRRWDGVETELGRLTPDGAEGRAAFELPRGRAGTCHLDAFARSADGAEGWATAELRIASAVTIEAVELRSRQALPARGPHLARYEAEFRRRGVDTPFVEVGEAIRGRVRLAGDPAGRQLRVSLADHRGRELMRQEMPAKAEQPFSFRAEPWLPALLRVEAKLLKGKEEVAFAYAFQRITRRRRGRFNFVLWDAPGDETLGPYAMEKLADMGVTAILHHTPAPLTASAHGMSYVPWTGGNVHARDAERWPQPDYGKWFAEHVLRSRGSGVLCYSLGDEGRVSGMGDGPNTDAALRAYLREVYGDIGALNRSWDTAFTSFDQLTVKVARDARIVAPEQIPKEAPPPAKPKAPTIPGGEPTSDDILKELEGPKEPAARKPAAPKPSSEAGRTARSYDLRYFGGYNFVRMAKKSRGWVRKLGDDPRAGIGFEGSGHLASIPCDPELICRELDMWVPYTGITEEFIRSVAPRSFIRSSWMGYSSDAVSHKGWYWRQVMNGADSVWYWMWSAIGAWQGLQGPDLEPPAPVQAMLNDTQIVRDGLGDLLLHYEMQHDGIAMLYSYPSIFVHGRSARNKTYPSHYAAFLAWQNVIHDLNMQYDFVTERILSSGAFAKRGYKVLILPQAWALSDKAIAAIRRFAEGGGTVMADVRPANYDERARQRASAAMDDLFGVKGGFAPPQSADMRIAGALGLSKLELVRPGQGHDRPVLIDPTVRLTNGEALGKAGDAPVCIVNTVGKGRAVLLNFAPHSSFRVRGDTRGLAGTATLDEMPHDAAVFFLGLFHAAGVERAFNFTQYKKEKVPYFANVKVRRWRNGDYQIVGFFRQTDTQMRRASFIPDCEKWPVSPQRKESGRPYPPRPWVYDIKNGLTVGQATWFTTEITPGSPSLYALLPGPLPPIAATAPRQARRGSPIRMTLAVPAARGLHCIKLRARTPEGQPAKCWDQSVLVGKEPREVVLPAAWNDPAGNWTIKVTDLFSAETEETVVISVH